MKKLLFLICIFCSLNTNAQSYLISFTTADETNILGTVKVENLSRGTSLIINGTDILRLSVSTTIQSVDNRQSSGIKIFPNPMTSVATVIIYPNETGEATVSVYDMTGILKIRNHYYFDNSIQELSLSGLNSGIYFVIVREKNHVFSQKLISYGSTTGTIKLVKNTSGSTVYKKPISKSKGTQEYIDMEYFVGERLKYTGVSGMCSTVITHIPTQDNTIIFNFWSCTDADNNNYPVVEIGDQTWMGENLKTTRYADGSSIPLVTDNVAWTEMATPAFCWYNNDEQNNKDYGALYNWYTIQSGNICPDGWYVPSNVDWWNLKNYLGGEMVAGGKLKETGTIHWSLPNNGATNETGFTAVPGSARSPFYGSFDHLGDVSAWWSSIPYSSTMAWETFILSESLIMWENSNYKKTGLNLRCLKY